MNLGILAVQGLVNSFGTTIMAAFAAAVKIDAFAYLPVQDFGNAFSIFVSQNYGAGRKDRIRQGHPGGGGDLGLLRGCAVGACLCLCRTADGAFYRRFVRAGRYCRRRALPAH